MALMKRNNRGHMVLSESAVDDIPCTTPEDVLFCTDRIIPKDADEFQYVGYPKVNEALSEHFDLSDKTTRQTILSLDEAGQNSVLTTLTSKLYDHIVKKTTDIDYGKIPETKGDITKLDIYPDLKDVCDILKGILKEYREKGGAIDTVVLAFSNLESRKDLFSRAYRADCELPIMIYENTVLATVNAVSYLIATCIEFIKAPSDETFAIQMDKVAYSKTRDYLLYTTLDKFNKACENGDIDKVVNHVIDQRVKKFTGTAIGLTVLGVVAVLNIIPILRELVYLFYYSKVKWADFFEVQADLLQMNAYNVQANKTLPDEERKKVVDKQLGIVDRFRKISNKLQIDSKQAEVHASREIQSNSKKYKTSDLDNASEEESEVISSLF